MPITCTLVKEASEGVAIVRAVTSDGTSGDHGLSAAWAEAAGFDGSLGGSAIVPGDEGHVVILVGLGETGDLGPAAFRTAGGAAARAARKLESIAIDALHVASDSEDLDAARCARALAEGVVLGAYDYDELRSESKASKLQTVEVIGKGGKKVQGALDAGVAAATATNVARDLVNEPGGSLTAPAFAKKAEKLGQEYGFGVSVMGKADIKKAKMGGLLGVNRGSELDPRFVELTWSPEGKARGTVALVGKGITFDSGGLSIKPSDGMIGMKGDMGGGAAVIAAFCALAALQPKVEVRGYVPMTDNMTGGDATRVGDVLTISSGKTVEVLNTDAEGRLILADALHRASEDGADVIVDLATLTGACVVALGMDIAGLMSNNDALVEQLLAAGETADEPLWHLPLPKKLRKALDSDIADIKNVGPRWGGSLTAGLFLQEFVGEGIPWAHLDIAGPAYADAESPTNRKGGTGFGARVLLEFLSSYKKV